MVDQRMANMQPGGADERTHNGCQRLRQSVGADTGRGNHSHSIGVYKGKGACQRTLVDDANRYDVGTRPGSRTGGCGHRAAALQRRGESNRYSAGDQSLDKPWLADTDSFGMGGIRRSISRRHLVETVAPLSTSLSAYSITQQGNAQPECGQQVNPLSRASSTGAPIASSGSNRPQESTTKPLAHDLGVFKSTVHTGLQSPNDQLRLFSYGMLRLPYLMSHGAPPVSSSTAAFWCILPLELCAELVRAVPPGGPIPIPLLRQLAHYLAQDSPGQSTASLPGGGARAQHNHCKNEQSTTAAHSPIQSSNRSGQSESAPAPDQCVQGRISPAMSTQNGPFGPSLLAMSSPSSIHVRERSELTMSPIRAQPPGDSQACTLLQPSPSHAVSTPAPAPNAAELGTAGHPIMTLFLNITAATAKCDICDSRNSAGLTRCVFCGWQSCHACTVANGCLRHHISGDSHHIGPTTEHELALLPRRGQMATAKRKAEGFIDQGRPHSREKLDNASKANVDMTREERPSTHDGSGDGQHIRRTSAQACERRTSRRPTVRKTTEEKAKPSKTTRSKSARRSAAKSEGKGMAEEHFNGASSISNPFGFLRPSDGHPDDIGTETAANSITEGARMLCQLSSIARSSHVPTSFQSRTEAANDVKHCTESPAEQVTARLSSTPDASKTNEKNEETLGKEADTEFQSIVAQMQYRSCFHSQPADAAGEVKDSDGSYDNSDNAHDKGYEDGLYGAASDESPVDATLSC